MKTKIPNETFIEVSSEIANYILREYCSTIDIDITDKDGNTSYTEQAQDEFNDLYDSIQNIMLESLEVKGMTV